MIPMIRIPYPVPEPLRSQLIAAGMEAVSLRTQEADHADASAKVRKVTAEIIFRHGFEE